MVIFDSMQMTVEEIGPAATGAVAGVDAELRAGVDAEWRASAVASVRAGMVLSEKAGIVAIAEEGSVAILRCDLVGVGGGCGVAEA